MNKLFQTHEYLNKHLFGPSILKLRYADLRNTYKIHQCTCGAFACKSRDGHEILSGEFTVEFIVAVSNLLPPELKKEWVRHVKYLKLQTDDINMRVVKKWKQV